MGNTYHVALPSVEEAVEQRKKLIEKIVQPTFAADPDCRLVQAEGADLEKIKTYLRISDFVIADMSVMDASVYYQIGYADGVGTPVIFLCEKTGSEWYQPADIRGRWYIEYRLEEQRHIIQVRKALWETVASDTDEDYSGSRYEKKISGNNEGACFLITPIGEEGSRRREKADTVLELIVNEALRGLTDEGAVRGDHSVHLRQIGADVRKQIAASDFCICDLSEMNPNVYYELGYADALNKQVVLIRDKAAALPSLMDGLACIDYDMENPKAQDIAVIQLREAIRNGRAEIELSSSMGKNFLEAVKARDIDRINKELAETKKSVNKKVYLLEYLPAAAKAGSWNAVEEMAGEGLHNAYNPYTVLYMKYASWEEKKAYFDVVTDGLLWRHIDWEDEISFFEYMVNCGRPSIATEMDWWCRGLIGQLDIYIWYELWKKKKQGCNEKIADVMSGLAVNSALLKYRMYINAPWKDRILKKGIKSLEQALEFAPENWLALYLAAEWSLRLDEGCWSGVYMNAAMEKMNRLLDLADSISSSEFAQTLKLAIRICRQAGDRADVGEKQKYFEAELEKITDVKDTENCVNWIPKMPDRNDALMYRRRTRKARFYYGCMIGCMIVAVLTLIWYWSAPK